MDCIRLSKSSHRCFIRLPSVKFGGQVNTSSIVFVLLKLFMTELRVLQQWISIVFHEKVCLICNHAWIHPSISMPGPKHLHQSSLISIILPPLGCLLLTVHLCTIYVKYIYDSFIHLPVLWDHCCFHCWCVCFCTGGSIKCNKL